jgi:predicted phosphoribosyltransferase
LEAGEKLAEELVRLELKEPVVVALPRGGVEVAVPIAKRLNAPVELLFVKKLGAPHNPEFAIGAVAESGLLFVNRDLAARLGVTEEELQQMGIEKIQEIARLRQELGVEPIPLEGRDVILVDDGVATGSTIYLAAQSVVRDRPNSITIAVPVAPADPEVLKMLEGVSHRLVILETHSPFLAVSRWYQSFPQLSTEEVKELLRQVEKRGEQS